SYHISFEIGMTDFFYSRHLACNRYSKSVSSKVFKLHLTHQQRLITICKHGDAREQSYFPNLQLGQCLNKLNVSKEPDLMEEVILVDSDDNVLGTMEKMEAHRK